MSKAKAPYTFPHKSRKAMVDYLTDIGGYNRSRGENYPLSFNVGAYGADLSIDRLVEGFAEHELGGPEFAPGTRAHALLMSVARTVYRERENDLFMDAVEDARSSVTDGDAYDMLYDTGTPMQAKWGFAGRSGKHLVLISVLGYSLEGMSEDEFENMLRGQRNPSGYDLDEYYPTLKKDHSWIMPTNDLTALYRFMRQCEIDFTTAKASQEVEYQAAWRFAQDVRDAYDTLYGSPEQTDVALSDDARTLLSAIPILDEQTNAALRRLCTAAGIELSELVEDNELSTN